MLFDPGRTLIYASTSNIAKDVTRLWKKKGEERRKGKEIEFLMHWSTEAGLQTEESRCHASGEK